MRTFGKDYESFYKSVQEQGVEFVRFECDIAVSRHNGRLQVTAKDVYSGQELNTLVDMVVLSTGFEPQDDQLKTAKKFGVSLSPDG